MRTKLRPKTIAVALGLTAALVLSACIEGPIEGTPSLSIGIDPAQVGYTTTEVFLFDRAEAYEADAPFTADGKLAVSADPDTSGADFKTRLVVIRPNRGFNGTVYVDWLNVTGAPTSRSTGRARTARSFVRAPCTSACRRRPWASTS